MIAQGLEIAQNQALSHVHNIYTHVKCSQMA